MPTVRSYGPSRVSRAPIPGVRKQAALTPTAAGVGLERAKEQTGQVISSIGAEVAQRGVSIFSRLAAEERAREDETALLEAEVALGKWENDRLHHPDTGALHVKGKASIPLPEEVGAEFDDVAGQLATTLTSDKQRAAFARSRVNHLLNLDGTLKRHVSREMMEHRGDVMQSTIETSVSTAIANANDLRRVGDELTTITDAIDKIGPSVGLGDEERVVAKRKAYTAVHAGVIDQLVADGQYKKAKAYFAGARDQIEGSALTKIEASLEEGTLRGESQQAADTIIRAGGTLTQQRDKAKAITDPEVRQATLQLIEHEDAVNDQIRREGQENASTAAFNILDKTKSLRAIPPGMWANFSGATKSALKNYNDDQLRGKPRTTDTGNWYRLMTMAGKDPQKFVNENLMNYKDQLTDADFQDFASLQRSIRKGEATPRIDGFLTNTQLVDSTLREAGIDTNAAVGTPEANAKAHLQRAIDRAVDVEIADGKRLSNTEIQQRLDALMKQEPTIEGSIWGFLPGIPWYTVKGKRLIDTKAGDIPASTRKLIERSLRGQGQPVNDRTVLDAYIFGKSQRAP